MAVSPDFQRYVIDQLAALGGILARRLFGGVGLYHDGLFFALMDDDTLYFKVDAANREDYVARGMRPFCPDPVRPAYEMGYYEVPADVLEDGAQLATWAGKSCHVARAARARKPVRKQAGRAAVDLQPQEPRKQPRKRRPQQRKARSATRTRTGASKRRTRRP